MACPHHSGCAHGQTQAPCSNTGADRHLDSCSQTRVPTGTCIWTGSHGQTRVPTGTHIWTGSCSQTQVPMGTHISHGQAREPTGTCIWPWVPAVKHTRTSTYFDYLLITFPSFILEPLRGDTYNPTSNIDAVDDWIQTPLPRWKISMPDSTIRKIEIL